LLVDGEGQQKRRSRIERRFCFGVCVEGQFFSVVIGSAAADTGYCFGMAEAVACYTADLCRAFAGLHKSAGFIIF